MFDGLADTPEGIALALFSLILTRAHDSSIFSPERMLKLFSECLRAAKGEAEEGEETKH